MRQKRTTGALAMQRKPPDWLVQKLSPLRVGKSVGFGIVQTRVNGKKTTKIHQAVLIAPGSYYGIENPCVVVSVIGKGSCIVGLEPGRGVAPLVKAGIPARYAHVLVAEIKRVIGGKYAST